MSDIVKDLPLTTKSMIKLIEAMSTDVNDALQYVTSTTPLNSNQFDMFEVDDWDWISYALCDIEAHVTYMGDQKKLQDNKIKCLEIKLRSKENGLKFWMDRYENEITAVKKQYEFWRDQFKSDEEIDKLEVG